MAILKLRSIGPVFVGIETCIPGGRTSSEYHDRRCFWRGGRNILACMPISDQESG